MYLFLILSSCNDNISKEDNFLINPELKIVEIYLIDPLDEPRGFCIDIQGYKESADIRKGLQAHTCYSYQGGVAIDQGFNFDQINIGEFYIPSFDVCMEAENTNSSSALKLESCSKSNLQKFIMNKNGSITLEDNKNLCLTISTENSREGGGGNPPHLIRNLTLENCDISQFKYQSWATRTN